MEEKLIKDIIASWKQIISRLDECLLSLDDEQLQKQIAPNRTLFYLLGDLTAIHDRTLPILGIGERLHPELDDIHITNPDRMLPDSFSTADLKKAWHDVNTALISGVEKFSAEDWLKKHTSVSDEGFAKDPTQNRLAVFLAVTFLPINFTAASSSAWRARQ